MFLSYDAALAYPAAADYLSPPLAHCQMPTPRRSSVPAPSASPHESPPAPPRLDIERLAADGLGPVSFAVSSGECLCLSGPSGCGKTRLLRAIADLDAHTGRVALDGVEQAAIGAAEWRRRVGLLPAENHWWLERAGDHFGTLPTAATLARLELNPRLLSEPITRLSSGERQRFALLRLLANRPQVLLLDEPTSNLDAHSGERVETLIGAYREREQAAVVWVSHDAEQIRRLNGRYLRMHPDGTLAMPGAPR